MFNAPNIDFVERSGIEFGPNRVFLRTGIAFQFSDDSMPLKAIFA